ncbi:DoxX family protein [Lacinutrix sp. C3R15]|uniref:DoxX family protein n=1 Tax=Flavobacteriaceae TaxID=49546 RepID=UPI001C0A51BB|nr:MULTISPECIES: DoxX family protein [Flavobacteriaceae]MBU2938518.1 DoxX family protein [Lacinutrix sp. C3R15]MDO6621832.1 DoxX family protein [Oceanihabitans sp. 1_MG-2023]
MKKDINFGLLLLRIIIAGLMLFHGIAKLSSLTGIENMLAEVGLPTILAYGVYVTELVAPILIIIGFRTRIASLVFFFGMIAALVLAHYHHIFAISKTGGLEIELLLLYAFGGLVFFFTGSGSYAVSTLNKWD